VSGGVDPVLEKTLATELDEPAEVVSRVLGGQPVKSACATLRDAAIRALAGPLAPGEERFVESVTGEILTLAQLREVADRFRV
jgi:uncharacterized protein YbcI